MSNSSKIWLLILALVLAGANIGFFLYSSNVLEVLSAQFEDEEQDAQELARVTETARTDDESSVKGLKQEGEKERGAKKSEESGSEPEKGGSRAKDGAKLAIKESESEVGAKEVARRDEKDNKEAPEEEEPETGVIKSKYQPKLIGQCKTLYQKYLRKGDFTGNHRAFSYSFDGNSGNCAFVEEQKSKQIAEKEALKACEKSKTDAANYAPCFVIASF